MALRRIKLNTGKEIYVTPFVLKDLQNKVEQGKIQRRNKLSVDFKGFVIVDNHEYEAIGGKNGKPVTYQKIAKADPIEEPRTRNKRSVENEPLTTETNA